MGVFGLIRRLRRPARLAKPFPDAWRGIVEARLPFAADYDDETRTRFLAKLQLFIAEKRFEGVGIDLTDEIRVTVAGTAARLTVHLGDDLYDAVESIVIRPTDMKRDDSRILGLVHRYGTVMLAWDAVKHGISTDNDGHDTALHEFAHAIDRRDGEFDGTPPLSGAALRTWARVCAEHFLVLREDPDRNVIRAYGAENEAEFFAVAVETYFEKPTQLKRKAPELYAVLEAYFDGPRSPIDP